MKKHCLLLIFTCLTQSCAANISVWKEEIPEKNYAFSEREKQEAYDKYRIKEVNVFKDIHDEIEMGTSGEKFYLDTVAPTIIRISPDSEKYYQNYKNLENTSLWTTASLLGFSIMPIAFSSLSPDLDQNTRWTLYGTTLAAMLVTLGIDLLFSGLQANEMNQLKAEYNQDLREHLHLDEH